MTSRILPDGEAYRTCAECGSDCQPETVAGDAGLRIVFVCPAHGAHAAVDPFEP